MSTPLSDADIRATVEAEVLGVVSGHGGEQIVAGPPMYGLVQELTDLVLNQRADPLGLRRCATCGNAFEHDRRPDGVCTSCGGPFDLGSDLADAIAAERVLSILRGRFGVELRDEPAAAAMYQWLLNAARGLRERADTRPDGVST